MKKRYLTAILAMLMALSVLTLGGCKKKVSRTQTVNGDESSITASTQSDGETDLTESKKNDAKTDTAAESKNQEKTDKAGKTDNTSASGQKDGKKNNSSAKTNDKVVIDNDHKKDDKFYDNTTEVPKDGASVEKKEIITVPVLLKENPGVNAGFVEYSYDSSVFTYVDYDEGEVFDNYSVNPTNGKIAVLFEKNNSSDGKVIDTDKTGRLITLKFTVNEKAKAGTYEIKVTKNEFASADEKKETEIFKPAMTIGKITVK